MPAAKHSRSADRTLLIFETFEAQRRPLTLRELAEYCGIPLSTCHALAHTLLSRAYLYQPTRRRYLYPTRRLADIGAHLVAHDPFLERMSPVLERLRDDSGETVILGTRQQDRVLYLEVLESPQTIRYSSRAGEYKPLASTCIGKTMLAALGPAELRKWLRGRSLPRVTEATITSRRRLSADLEQGRRRGYFVTRGENVPDVTALAVPIRVSGVLLGLALAGPSHRMASRLARHAARLHRAQRELHEQGIAT